MKTLDYDQFLKRIKEIPVIDTHEHITAEKGTLDVDKDVFDLLTPYVCDNLLTAGMSKEDFNKLLDKKIKIEDRWNIFEPYLEDIKFTTYFQAVLKVINKFYGYNELNKYNFKEISNQIRAKQGKDYYDYYMNQCNIKQMYTYVDYTPEVIEYFKNDKLKPVPTVSLALPKYYQELKRFKTALNVDIDNLDDLEQEWEKLFKYYFDNGVTAIKIGSGYNRKLNYLKVDRAVAYTLINKLINNEVTQLSEEEGNLFDNYMIDYMLKLAQKYNMLVVFHVGLHAWNENVIERCFARYLTDLVSRYPKVKFLLLHSGIPFIDEAILLCKYYSNVYLNMTWMHIIDREKSKEAIKRYIEMLPISKITAFGGDYSNIENVYGHYEMAIENLGEVFYEYVKNDVMTEQEALIIIKKWLYSNAINLFK